MRALGVVLAIVVAFLVQTLGGRYFWLIRSYLDLFLLTAAGFGLTRGRRVGMWSGTAAGLVQDAFSGGMLGLNGLSKTVVGYLSGIAGQRLMVRGGVGRFLFFSAASATDLVILTLIGQAVEQPLVIGEGAAPLYFCAGNGLVGAVVLGTIERFSATRS